MPRATTVNGDWLIASRAKFKENWDSEGAAAGGNLGREVTGHCRSFIDETRPAEEQLFVRCWQGVFAARNMSRNAVQDGYFISTDNDENRGAVKLHVKDAEEMRVPVQGKRTVLGTLTNKPFSNVALKPKQVQTTFFRERTQHAILTRNA